MIALAMSLMSSAVFSTLLVLAVAGVLRLRRNRSEEDIAFAWWVTCWTCLAGFAVAITQPFSDRLVTSLFERMNLVRFFGGEPYVPTQGAWGPVTGGWMNSVATAVVIGWVVVAGVILILRGYQLFLASQFAAWSRPLDDDRIETTLRSLDTAGTVRARTSTILRTPAVVGLWRSTLLIPAGMTQPMSDQQVRAILAHELAHVRGRDTRTVVAMLVCETLLWFNPLVWWMHREWGAARECVADRQAIKAAGISGLDFGNLLLDVLGSNRPPFLQTSIGAAHDFRTLKRRILTMTQTDHRVSTSHRFRWTIGLALVAMLVVPRSSALESAPQSGGNLVSNPGFEQGLDKWTRANLGGHSDDVTFAIDTATKHGGNASLKVTKSVGRFWPVQMVGQGGVGTSGITSRLKVTLWAKADRTTKLTLAVHFRAGAETKHIEFGSYVGGDEPVTHDWKQYEKVVAVPDGTQSLALFLQMYGPGEVWIDDLDVRYVDGGTHAPPANDPEIETIKIEKKLIGGDPKKEMHYIRGGLTPPEKGFKVAIVLPGGDGSADFKEFVRRIFFHCGEMNGFVFAQLVAPKWTEPQGIVWPLENNLGTDAKFSTESFIREAIAEIGKSVTVDPEHVYVMGWSSGGPAAYGALLSLPEVRGAFVAMSVFKPVNYTGLQGAKGKRLYLYQSPDDKITAMRWAKDAESKLKDAGATVQLVEYAGGHGFQSGDVFGDLRKGFDWLIQR